MPFYLESHDYNKKYLPVVDFLAEYLREKKLKGHYILDYDYEDHDLLRIPSLNYEDSTCITQETNPEGLVIVEVWFYQGNTYEKKYETFKEDCLDLIQSSANLYLKDEKYKEYCVTITQRFTTGEGRETDFLIFKRKDEYEEPKRIRTQYR